MRGFLFAILEIFQAVVWSDYYFLKCFLTMFLPLDLTPEVLMFLSYRNQPIDSQLMYTANKLAGLLQWVNAD